MALDRASLLGIRLTPVSCHSSNAQRFIVVFHQCLVVNSGALLKVRPRHFHRLYVQLTAFVYCHPVILNYIHLLQRLPHDSFRALSKETSPQNEIQCFLFQFAVSCRFLKVIQQLLTSFPPSSSHHFYPSFCLFFNNLFQKIIHTQDMTNAVNLPLNVLSKLLRL